MVLQTNISFQNDIWYNDKFQEAKNHRKLSKIINQLLREYFTIERTEIPSDETSLEMEIEELSAKKALLERKKAAIKEEREKEKLKTAQEIYQTAMQEEMMRKW